MPTYRVRRGFTHGAFNQYKAGAVVQHTAEEAAGFLDKLELVTVGPSLIESQSVTKGQRDLPFGGLLVTPNTVPWSATPPAGNDTPPSPTTDPNQGQQPPEGETPPSGLDQGQPPTGNEPQGGAETPPEPFDVSDATIEEVLAAVEAGEVTAGDALIAEQQGSKRRTTLIAELTKLVEAQQGGASGEAQA